jgi:capsular polysaccharide biosynthesis protein
MDEQHVVQMDEEEISLKELFLALWKQKVVIISITLIMALLTGIISVFFIPPAYHSKLNIIIHMPETFHTKYGDYTLPITSNDQYINLITSNDILIQTVDAMGYDTNEVTIEKLRERITIGAIAKTNGMEQNSFDVTVEAGNPLEAQQLAQALFDNYMEFIDVTTVEGALNHFTTQFTTSLKSLQVSLDTTQKLLAKNEELLAETPQTINQKEAMNEIESQVDAGEFIVLENVINPNYTKVENDIIGNKQAINSIENSIRVQNEYLVELDSMRDRLSAYYETGDFKGLQSNMVSVTKSNIYLPSAAVVPSRKTSPSNAKNVILGTLLGGMVGVLAAFIKEYWFKKN